MPPLANWTKLPPTETGYYVLAWAYTPTATVCEVDPVEIWLDADSNLNIGMMGVGDDIPVPVDDDAFFGDGKWFYNCYWWKMPVSEADFPLPGGGS